MMMLPTNFNRAAFVVSCANALADAAWNERGAITNMAINTVICYTKPVQLPGYGFISLLVLINNTDKIAVPEIHVFESEEVFYAGINKKKNYTTHVAEVNAQNIMDGVKIEYPARTGAQFSSLFGVGVNVMEIFASVVLECLNFLVNEYFPTIGFDANRIYNGYGMIGTSVTQDGSTFSFLDNELVVVIDLFRYYGNNQIDYDFRVGFLLTGMRSTKDDSKFSGIKL